MITFKKLDQSHHRQVVTMLAETRLPFEDIDLNVHHMIGAYDGERLKGIAALELYGQYALLRSVAVDTREQQKGLGSTLIEEVLKTAKALNLSNLYLLTETAEGFFSKLGFVKTERSEVPTTVMGSREFKYLCPESAICMMRQI
ncbi:tyrosine phosphatase [Fulvivirga imtechensis AK7]|uniref:Tyrosine phosphatase n=1 Tax=Fulvivirga imtechensis AK7 TaxID=1237149 RepID=L8JU14_9BACT|nr:arsenic resistance N-acetyltransferase ArsN2 [Fulvivirga imtechensis]ELR70782.1 tyrosine phosphatase [Fulvivirga imtechensis AK7]